MTKAATIGAKRRRKALQRDCPISGVTIAAEPKAAVRRSERDTEAHRRALMRACARIGWPQDDEHCRRVSSQACQDWAGTLYGRLHLAGRISEDAACGLERWDELHQRYRRGALGTLRAAWLDGNPAALEPDEYDDAMRDLAREWADARVVLNRQPADVARLVMWAIEPDRIEAPCSAVNPEQARWLGIVGHELARHFGMRA
jgi:hypothetical protein